MPRYPEEGWTGDPMLDGLIWAIGVPLNSELVLLEGRGRPASLMADAMHRFIEQGIDPWRVTEKPRGAYLLVEAPRIIRCFVKSIGWKMPRDDRFDYIEVLVKDNGREPPRDVPRDFLGGFFAGRIRLQNEAVVVDWPGTEERISECLYRHGIEFSVPEEGKYRFPEPSAVPGFNLYDRHRNQAANPSEFELLDTWPPLSGSTEPTEGYAVERLRDV